MHDLYIIAAGKGSRMGGSIPKALVPITDKPNLTTTLQQIGHKFFKVYVVTNEEAQGPWEEYFSELRDDFPELAENVVNLPIKSGRGDGHAVLAALQLSMFYSWPLADDIVVAWGDVFFPDAAIIDELLEKSMKVGVVPVVKEKDPYVTIKIIDDMTVTHAEFSKLGENNDEGYHDQSVFRFNRPTLGGCLDALNDILDRNGTYISPNGELSMLYVFHTIFNVEGGGIKAYETEYPTMSFNTVEEVAQIQQEIDQSWKNKFRNQSSSP